MLYGINVVVPGCEAQNVGYSESMPAAVKFIEMLERSNLLTEKKCMYNVVPITDLPEQAWAYTMRTMCKAAKDSASCFDVDGVWHIPVSQIIECVEQHFS